MDKNIIGRKDYNTIDTRGKFLIEDLCFVVRVDMVHVENRKEQSITKNISHMYKLTERNIDDMIDYVLMENGEVQEKLFMLFPVYDSIGGRGSHKIVTYRAMVNDCEIVMLEEVINTLGFVYVANFDSNEKLYKYDVEDVTVHVYYKDFNPNNLLHRCYSDQMTAPQMDFIWTSQGDFYLCQRRQSRKEDEED